MQDARPLRPLDEIRRDLRRYSEARNLAKANGRDATRLEAVVVALRVEETGAEAVAVARRDRAATSFIVTTGTVPSVEVEVSDRGEAVRLAAESNGSWTSVAASTDDPIIEVVTVVTVVTVVAGVVRDRAEATDPESALLAASVLLGEAQAAGCGRPTASFYVNGSLVREGVARVNTEETR